MAKFVTLTKKTGEAVIINPDQIVSLEQYGSDATTTYLITTGVMSGGAHAYLIQGSPLDVWKALS